MKNSHPPATSIAAYRSLDPNSVQNIKNRIVEAIKINGAMSAEQIANFIGVDHVQVNRRTSELERDQLIYRPGSKSITKTGRAAFNWQIRGDNQPKTDAEENKYKGKTTATDHANNILKITQPTLFQ